MRNRCGVPELDVIFLDRQCSDLRPRTELVALEADARLKQRLRRREAQMQINDRSGTLVVLWLIMTLPHAAVV
jgi:hypothetical protein